jgi:hypothetical protein
MAKKTKTEDTVKEVDKVSELLESNGCVPMWEAKPKGKPFTIEAWLTTERQFIIVQRSFGGAVSYYSETVGDELFAPKE